MKLEKRIWIPLILLIVFVVAIIALNFKWAGLSPPFTSKLEFSINNKLVISAEVDSRLLTSKSASLSFDICDLQKKDYADLISALKDKKVSEGIITLLDYPKISNLCPLSASLSPSLSASDSSSGADSLGTSDIGYSCGTSADPQCTGTCPPGYTCTTTNVQVQTCTCPLDKYDTSEIKRLVGRGWAGLFMQVYKTEEYACPSVCDPFGEDICLRMYCPGCGGYPKIYAYCQEGVKTVPGCACVPEVPHT